MIDTVSPSTLNEWKKKENVYLIDVREQEEFDEGHIEGAKLLPLSSFDISNVPHQNKPIVIYCRSGARSAHACMILKNSSFEDVHNLEGGILNWARQGFEVN